MVEKGCLLSDAKVRGRKEVFFLVNLEKRGRDR